MYAFRAIDVWFDFKLCEGLTLLINISVQTEAKRHGDLLEMEYDSSVEESYYALPKQLGNIGISFESSIEEVKRAML